ncbi:DUF2075 domain-containing protein [Microlunatus soli]|uniref:DUF2075 domain-containing protein n=1 Tax=Microlunatus soli TaxID=630515 RepID=UPI001E30829C|nr:DUF2075 domain-containing protein [Microlunatus soli]
MPTLSEQYRHQLGRSVPDSEARSWARSLDVLSADLLEAGLGSVEALVEYQLPLTSKRADVVLCGTHPSTGRDQYVVVELKQWSRVQMLDGTDNVCLLEGLGEQLHPLEQVRTYCTHLTDFIGTLSDEPDAVSGVAYLHNATDLDVDALFEYPQDELGRLFTGQRRGDFHTFLQSRLDGSAGVDAADRLLSSAVRPSKQLLTLAADEVQQREQFVLLDEQRVAYELVMRAVDSSYRANTKEVIIVTGGPGSGKSVIALSLLGELSRRGRTVLHATGSSAFTQTLRKVAGNRAPRVKQMFKYFNQFVDAEQNGLDVLICDEAHRLRETSANRYTAAHLRTGKAQVAELIDAARVPVFLLDEHQVVRPGELGTVADIKAAATQVGLTTRVVELDGQFRCGGSRAYETWVLRLLGLAPGGPARWDGDESFILRTAVGPSELESLLRNRLEAGYGARLAAGFCWPWSDPIPGGLKLDVEIGDWHKPWNNKKQTSHAGAPGTPFWASDPAGFEQVGCVYTAQGFEYDYAGVIMGPDLVWRTDRWVARPEHSHDTAAKRGTPEQFDRAVRNTYKVLLTRGMIGTAVYSTDPETQHLLDELIPQR